ncbi:MAG: hypothetical protein ACJ8FY_01375 [Gemmataceae bacterium]
MASKFFRFSKMAQVPFARVKRQRLSIGRLADSAGDVEFWRSQSPQARLAYMEYLRLINYGQAAVSGRLKRVLARVPKSKTETLMCSIRYSTLA